MKRDSSARRSSTMVAVSVAAVVIPVVVGMSLLPGADAATKACAKSTSGATECPLVVEKGDTISIDCTGHNNYKNPTALLNSDATTIKVCKGPLAAIDASCTAEELLKDVGGIESIAPVTDGWSANFNGFTGDKDVVISGACGVADKTKGRYFNMTLKATPKSSGSSGATSAFGLATASSVALLGLVVAAA